MKQKLFLLTAIALIATTHTVWAHAHIHIGRNMDKTAETDDDNKLFLFGMASSPEDYWPNFPQWGDDSDPYDMTAEPLKLVYQDSGISKGQYLCEYIGCFHSAHPDHGKWQLGGINELIDPVWSIGIKRVEASEKLEFLDDGTLGDLLPTDGAQIVFSPEWFSDKPNENGESGAWGIHTHILFVVDGDGVEIGDTFYATIRAFDENGIFSDSQDYTLRFEAVPEPATLVMMAMGSLALLRRK